MEWKYSIVRFNVRNIIKFCIGLYLLSFICALIQSICCNAESMKIIKLPNSCFNKKGLEFLDSLANNQDVKLIEDCIRINYFLSKYDKYKSDDSRLKLYCDIKSTTGYQKFIFEYGSESIGVSCVVMVS